MTIKPAITDITIANVRSNIDFISAYIFCKVAPRWRFLTFPFFLALQHVRNATSEIFDV